MRKWSTQWAKWQFSKYHTRKYLANGK